MYLIPGIFIPGIDLLHHSGTGRRTLKRLRFARSCFPFSLFFLDLKAGKLLKELLDISVLFSSQAGTNIEVVIRRKKQSE